MRKFTKLILAALIACSAAACSSSSSETPATSESTEPVEEEISTEGTEITIWHTFTEDQQTELEALAAAFEEQTGIKVNCQSQPYSGFESAVYEAVSNGVGPDFIFNYASLAIDYDAYGLSLNFSAYWDEDFDYASLVSEGIYNEGVQGFADGGVHAVAVQSTGPVFFYNKTMYDKLGLTAPTTWDDVWNNAKAIYEEYNIPGFAVDSMPDFATNLMLQTTGGKFVDLDTNELAFTAEDIQPWVEWFKAGVEAGYFQIAPTTGDYNSNDINAGVLAAYIGSSAGIPYLSPANGDEIAVCANPQIDPENPYVVGWNRSVIGFKSDDEAKNKAVAMFAQFMTEAENDKDWVITLNAYSPYTATQELADYQEYVSNDIALVALGEQIGYSVVVPSYPNATNVRDYLKELFSSTASDSTKDVATEVASTIEKCNATIKEGAAE